MPKLAKKMGTIKPSVIMQIAKKTRTLKTNGYDIIDFSIGVPNFFPAPHIYEAAKNAIDHDTGSYLSTQGQPDLLTAFRTMLKNDGLGDYNANEVCVGFGAKNILFNMMLTMVDAGDEILIPSPYWPNYLDQLDIVEAKAVFMHCNAGQNYKLTPAQLETAITPKTKLLLFNNPSNPTGMVYTADELKALGDVLIKHDIWILSDDIYNRLVFDNLDCPHLLHSHPELKDRLIIIQSISKNYGMPGWRVGLMAGNEKCVKMMMAMAANNTMNVPEMTQAAAMAAISGSQDFVENQRDKFQARRDKIMKVINSIDGITCPYPQGAFYVFPDISSYFGTSFNGEIIKDSYHLCELMLEYAKVAIVPGSPFGEEKAIRISYACPDKDFEKGIARFKAFFTKCEKV